MLEELKGMSFAVRQKAHGGSRTRMSCSKNLRKHCRRPNWHRYSRKRAALSSTHPPRPDDIAKAASRQRAPPLPDYLKMIIHEALRNAESTRKSAIPDRHSRDNSLTTPLAQPSII